MWWLLAFLGWVQTPDTLWRQSIESRLQRDSNLLLKAVADTDKLSPLALQEYVLTLGQNGDPAGLTGITALWDNDAVQGSALFAYGEVDGAPIAPLLALEPRVQSRNRLLFVEALSKLAGPGDGGTLFQVWKRLPSTDRERALFYLWRNKPEPLTQAVFEKLRNNPKPEDTGYVYYLYRSRTTADAKLLTALIPLFRDDAQALIYLTRITPSEGDPELDKALRKLCQDDDWRVRVNALNAISDREWKRASGMALLADSNPNVVHTALTALVGLGQPQIDKNLVATPDAFSPAEIEAMIDAADADHVSTYLPLARNWLDSKDIWKHRKALVQLGKDNNPRTVARLMTEVARGKGGEAALAFEALKLLPGIVDGEMLRAIFASGDPYLMAGALDPIAEHKISFSREALVDLVQKNVPEPDFHYRYLDRIEDLAPAGKTADILASLREHDQYQVRLKALSVTKDPSLDLRRGIFRKPWRSRVPEEVTTLAVQLIQSGEKRKWTLRTTKGLFTIHLEGAYAPITCANIVYLSRNHFFDHMPIHRVVPNFVVQAGDPRGDGSGGPGYAIPCEINTLRYRRGTVGMALAGKDTGGSQFFICHSDQPHLDGGYTVFGKVTRGMDVVDRLEEGDQIISTEVR